MSIEGKKKAFGAVFERASSAYFKAAAEIMASGLPPWVQGAQVAGIKSVFDMQLQSMTNTPAERFNEDGSLKPYEPKEGETLIGVNK